MSDALKVQNAITPVIGKVVGLLKTLTIADINAPTLIWINPIRADAFPALEAKGAMESADAFGNKNPWQHKNNNTKTIVEYSSLYPKIDVATKTMPTIPCAVSAIFIICSELNFFNNWVLN